MTSAHSAPLSDRVVTQRARRRTLLERRRRFWRGIVLFVFVTIAMVLAGLANRDLLYWRDIQAKTAMVAAALQETYEREKDPPLLFPNFRAPHEELHERYYFNMFYANQKKWRPQVGVCCLKKASRFFLRADGRAVVLFDGKQFTPHWMTEGEFRAAAVALGFDSSLL
ncbi:MAG: hypothetical protein ACE5I3_05125, partial [Phycisphaerae bacterium]